MTFGQQPQNNGQYNPQYNTPDYNAAQQSGYASNTHSPVTARTTMPSRSAPTYQYVPQYWCRCGCGHHQHDDDLQL